MEITFDFSRLRFIEDDTGTVRTVGESGQIRFRYINPGSGQMNFSVM